MRGIAVIFGLSTIVAGAPAVAQGNGFYAAGELGAVVSAETDQQYTPGATAGSTGNISTEHDLGLTGAAVLGYNFGSFRVEAEAGYLSADVKELSSSFASGVALAAGSQDGDGDITVRTVMANALVDFADISDFKFFVGAGVGTGKLSISDLSAASGSVPVLDDEGDWKFAWQAIVGLRKSLTSNIDVYARYRYLQLDDSEMVGLGGRVVISDLTTQALTAGVAYKF